MREGRSHPEARASLQRVLPAALKPLLTEAEVTVQTFQDQKRNRNGYGDILFLPKNKGALSKEQRAGMKRLLAVLDPSLVKP